MNLLPVLLVWLDSVVDFFCDHRCGACRASFSGTKTIFGTLRCICPVCWSAITAHRPHTTWLSTGSHAIPVTSGTAYAGPIKKLVYHLKYDGAQKIAADLAVLLEVAWINLLPALPTAVGNPSGKAAAFIASRGALRAADLWAEMATERSLTKDVVLTPDMVIAAVAQASARSSDPTSAGNKSKQSYNILPDVLRSNIVLVPVPMHHKRYQERGYNQAELLAMHFGKHAGIPVAAKALTRVRETKPQYGLNKTERKENLAGAFAADRQLVQNKIIILVDDVFTSGATLSEAALSALRAGAAGVAAITVSRAV